MNEKQEAARERKCRALCLYVERMKQNTLKEPETLDVAPNAENTNVGSRQTSVGIALAVVTEQTNKTCIS